MPRPGARGRRSGRRCWCLPSRRTRRRRRRAGRPWSRRRRRPGCCRRPARHRPRTAPPDRRSRRTDPPRAGESKRGGGGRCGTTEGQPWFFSWNWKFCGRSEDRPTHPPCASSPVKRSRETCARVRHSRRKFRLRPSAGRRFARLALLRSGLDRCRRRVGGMLVHDDPLPSRVLAGRACPAGRGSACRPSRPGSGGLCRSAARSKLLLGRARTVVLRLLRARPAGVGLRRGAAAALVERHGRRARRGPARGHPRGRHPLVARSRRHLRGAGLVDRGPRLPARHRATSGAQSVPCLASPGRRLTA
jgi:hypothetical protein